MDIAVTGVTRHWKFNVENGDTWIFDVKVRLTDEETTKIDNEIPEFKSRLNSVSIEAKVQKWLVEKLGCAEIPDNDPDIKDEMDDERDDERDLELEEYE